MDTSLPYEYELCVLGAGPAGFAAAMRAHDLGLRTLLVERDRPGGAGLHAGALSSKTMWHLSNDYALARRTDRGFRAHRLELSYKAVMDSVQAAVAERAATLQRQLDSLHEGQDERFDYVRATGHIVGSHAVELALPDGTKRRHTVGSWIIATGSVPRVPPQLEVDGEVIVTSDQLESWKEFPKSLVIVGAGVIGCEYASIFANFGRTKIFLIDRQPRILPFEDEDVAECVARNFESNGVTIHRQASLQSLRRVGHEVEYVIQTPQGQETRRVERCLVAVGRVPNTRGLGIEALGIELEASGGIPVDQTRSKTLPHVYAAGDTTMDLALANVAELEGRHAVERIAQLTPKPLRYDALSAIMFLKPEVASVGMNELQARQRGIAYRVAVLRNQLVARNIAMRSTDGFIKLLASHDPPHRILGLRVVGAQASSCIQGIAFLIEQGGHLEDIDACVHPHPAVTEGVQECARLLLGRSLLKTSVFGPELLRCASWPGTIPHD